MKIVTTLARGGEGVRLCKLPGLLGYSRWILPGLLFLIAEPAFAQPELKGTPSDLAMLLTNVPRIVQITGEAEIKTQADWAILSVKIGTGARELGQALRVNQDVRGKFAGLLAAKGVPASQVQASSFSSTEKYGLFSDKVKSHRVSNLLNVTVRSEKEFQIVADAIDSLPEAQYLGVKFERSDKEQLKAKAIAEACDNATQRKKVFEEKLGLKLTVRRFFDPACAPLPADTIMGGYRAQSFSASASSGLPAASDYGLAVHAMTQREDDRSGFGELTFRSRVTVEYLAEGK
jgi:uncharacterized protein